MDVIFELPPPSIYGPIDWYGRSFLVSQGPQYNLKDALTQTLTLATLKISSLLARMVPNSQQPRYRYIQVPIQSQTRQTRITAAPQLYKSTSLLRHFSSGLGLEGFVPSTA